MCPYLLEVGGFQIGTYGLFMAAGFLVCGLLLARELERRGYDPEFAWELVIVAALTGVMGARLFAALEEFDLLLSDPLGTLITRGGLTWYGGLIVATPACVALIRFRKLPLLAVMDAVAPLLLLGYAFGRGGCQVSGDGCYGHATSLPWGMTYDGGLVPAGEPVHPTPLYEIIYSVAGFAVLWFWLRLRDLPRGSLFALFFFYSAVARFLVEFLRLNARYWFSFADGPRVITSYPDLHGAADLVGLSLSQWISIGLFLLGAIWLCAIFVHARITRPG